MPSSRSSHLDSSHSDLSDLDPSDLDRATSAADLINGLRQRLQGREPEGEASGARQASVLVPIITEPEPAVLYVLRSQNLPSHAGEVAFPGGKREAGDRSLWETALRESREEIALESAHAEPVGQLNRTMSRFGLEVTPCVALLSEKAQWRIASPETAAIFTMPLEQLLYSAPPMFDHFEREGIGYRLPRWKSEQGMEIWGLTARITAELLEQAFNDDRELCNESL